MRTAAILASAAFAAIPVTAVAAGPTIQADIPDFYQHQKAWTPGDAWPGAATGYTVTGNDWWESFDDRGSRVRVGWCGTTAWTNALYHWSKNGYTDLFDHSSRDPKVGPPYHGGRNWLERAIYMNEDLALRADATDGSCAWVPDVRQYVNHWTGVDPAINRYLWQNGRVELLTEAEQPLDLDANGDGIVSGDASGYASMWGVFRNSMSRGYTCTIRIGTGNDPNLWWAGSFHVLTGAGYDVINGERFLYLADPNDTSGNANAGADWGHAYTPAEGDGAIPVGLAHYTRVKLAPDGRTIVGGTFDGCPINAVYTMMVPAPGVLSLLGVAGFLTSRRRARPA